jgi:hypothetical protein
MLAAGESAFSAQLEHAALPEAFLYFPALHAVQFPLSGPVYPTLYWQLLLPRTENELSLHTWQAAFPELGFVFPSAKRLAELTLLSVLFRGSRNAFAICCCFCKNN